MGLNYDNKYVNFEKELKKHSSSIAGNGTKYYSLDSLSKSMTKSRDENLGNNISDILKNLKNISEAIKNARKNIKKDGKSEEEEMSMDEIGYILDDIDNFIEGILPAVNNAEDMAKSVKKEEKDGDEVKENDDRSDTVDKIRKILEGEEGFKKENLEKWHEKIFYDKKYKTMNPGDWFHSKTQTNSGSK